MIKLLRFPLLLVVVWLFSGCAYFNTYYNAQRYFREGVKSLQRSSGGRVQTGRLNDALVVASRVLEFYPESRWVDDALLLMGKSYYYLKNYFPGLKKFDELIQQFPDSPLIPEAYLWKAKTLVELHKYDEAKTSLVLIVRGKVKKQIWVESRLLMGTIHDAQGNYALAREAYQQVLLSARRKDLKGKANLRLGQISMKQGEYADASEFFARVPRFHPGREEEFTAALGRIEAEIRLNRLDKARRLIKKALKDEHFFEDWDAFTVLRCRIIQAQGEDSLARECYKEHLREFQHRVSCADAAFQLGLLYFRNLNQLDSARTYFQRVGRESNESTWKDSSEYFLQRIEHLGQLRTQLEQLGDSLRRVEVDLNPDSVRIREVWKEVRRLQARRQAEQDSLAADSLAAADSLLREEPEVAGKEESDSPRKSHRRFRDPGIRGEEADSLLADSLLRLETARRDTALFRSVLDTITLEVQIDSSRLLKRLDSLRRQQREKLLTLGEFYIYNMHLFDLADSLFAALDSSAMDDDQLMKRLYYRGELRVMQGDTTAGRAWFAQLIDRFPGSEAAKYLRKRLGLEEGKSREDYARELFAAAAVTWYDSLDYLSALEKYRRVTEEYPGTSLAPRAWLARIYLWNKVLENPEAARRDYEKLRSDYPDAPATEQASLWLGEVMQPRGPEEEEADRETSQLAEDQLLAPRIDESGRFIRPDEDAPLEVKLENFREHVFSLGNIKVDRILK